MLADTAGVWQKVVLLTLMTATTMTMTMTMKADQRNPGAGDHPSASSSTI
jgi:hypothetical protein